jgi:hypothetical protein
MGTPAASRAAGRAPRLRAPRPHAWLRTTPRARRAALATVRRTGRAGEHAASWPSTARAPGARGRGVWGRGAACRGPRSRRGLSARFLASGLRRGRGSCRGTSRVRPERGRTRRVLARRVVAAGDAELLGGAAWLSREGERGKRVGLGEAGGGGQRKRRARAWASGTGRRR